MLQDIKDEILSGDPRYTIRDSSGNVLNDNVDISLKTPITQEGTPVNRALFRNLQGDLYTQDRYNITTVTQEFLPVDYMTEHIYSETTKQEDFLPKTWTSGGTMTLPSGESGEYFYSDTSSGRFIVMGDNSYAIYSSIKSAFDGSTSTMCRYDGSTLHAFIVLPKPTRIKKIKLAMGGSGGRTNFSSCTIYGSLDGKSYTLLRSISYNEYKANGYDALSEWTLSTLGYYKYYKASVYTGDSTWDAYLSEFQVSEYDDTQWGDYFYNHTLDLPLTSYEKGKIVNIEVGKYGSITSMSNCLLNINNLGYKPINDSIDSGKKYSLVYNGASWDIANVKIVTGSFTPSETKQYISLPFVPDLVIIYNASNNSAHVTNYTKEVGQQMVPKILTNVYNYTEDVNIDTGGCYISENGFYDRIRYTNTYGDQTTRYYIAIKF